jgi:hypothetical protein
VASALATITPSSGAGDDREIAQAMELSRQVRRDFEARDTLYEYIDAVLYGAIDYVPPKGYRKIARATHNPLAVYMTSTITAALTVDPPEVQFPVLGVGDAARTNATLRSHFFDGSWQRQEDEAEVPIFRRFTHSVVCKGEGALKTVPRSRMAWSSYTDYAKTLTDRLTDGDLKTLSIDEKDRLYSSKTEEYKKTQAPYPIKSIDVQPETFYYWKGEDGLTLVDEHKTVPYLETLVRYGQALDREGRIVPQGMGQALPANEWRHAMSGTSQLTMDELWTWDRCRYCVAGPGQMGQSEASRAGSLVRSFRHRYGDPVTKSLRGPYAHCLGTTTASRLPERAGLGVLYGFLDLFVYLDELLTYQQINAALTSLASFKRNRPPGTGLPDSEYGEDGRQSARQPVYIEPGAVLGDDIGPVEMPRAGQALGDTIAQTREFIELILPKVLQGVVDTTDSGYQLALAARLGRIAFDPMVANIRRAAARRVAFESWLIEYEIGERVYVTGVPIGKKGQRKGPEAGVISIGPDELNGVHTGYVVKLQPEDKASELVEVRKHGELVQQGFEARATAQEALGLNPEEEEVKMLTEQMKQDPAIQADFKQRVNQKLGLLEQQAVQAGDAALAGAGVMPPQQPQAGAALQGAGQVFEGAQNLPIAPGGPGQMGVPAQPGGLPASIPGQPGTPPLAQAVNPNPAMAGIGVIGG